MNIFYELTAVDTLFFRGNIPMEAGMLASESFFPPPTSVFSGAIRTHLGKEKGKWETEKADFEITAILFKKNFKKNETIYYPAPYSWFKVDGKEEIITETKDLQSSEYREMEIQCSSENIPFVDIKNAKSLGGKWVDCYNAKIANVCNNSNFYKIENRVGIALDYSKRAVEKGKLYSANHIRLEEGVSIIIGIEYSETDNHLPLENNILYLGGEKRIAKYKSLDKSSIKDIPGNISLAPILATQKKLDEIFATGKIIYISGWDLNKKYHKPSQGYFPAGTVFNKPIKEIL